MSCLIADNGSFESGGGEFWKKSHSDIKVESLITACNGPPNGGLFCFLGTIDLADFEIRLLVIEISRPWF